MSTFPFRSTKVGAAVKGVIGTSVAVPMLFAAMPALAQSQQDQMREMQQMRQQMQELQTRFDQLQAQQQQGGSSSAADNGPGFMVGKSRIEINGYIKVDGIYDFNGDDGASLGPSDALDQLDGQSTDPHFGGTAKQTRLKIKSTTPTQIGDVGGYIEMDMYGDGSFGLNGNYQPRIRRAYITVGNWLIGKEWTTFSDFNYGTMLNFYGPQAQIFERQAQVRYTQEFGGGSSLDVALETPDGHSVQRRETNPDGSVERVSESGDEQFPDLVFRFKSSIGDLSYQAAAIGTYIEADSFDSDGNSDEDSTFGYGLDLGASYALPTGTTLMLSANYGEGDAKYVYDPAGGADAYIDDDGDVEAIERYGYIATLSQELAPKLTGNIVWGQGFSEDYDDNPANHKRSSTAAVNLLYTPVDPLTLGVEYDRAAYKNQGGADGHVNWLQVSAIYNF